MTASADGGIKYSRSKYRLASTRAFVVQYYLPLIFAVAITLALAWPNPGSHVVHVVVLDNVHIVQEVNIAIVFFISGLVLNTDDLYKAKGHVLAVLYGFVAILLITPCLGFAMRELPLEPQLFTIGLVIFCIVPTTLGIGVALVRMCKGNDGIALLMTVGTNLIGVGTMPLSLKLMFLHYDLTGLSVKIDALNLFTKLAITALAPSVLGKVLREVWPAARTFAGTYRTALSMVSTTQLAFIVWQTLSGARDLLFQAKAWSIISVIALAASIYLFYLLINYTVITTCFRLPTPEAISVIIMASQKSSPVAITVISYITSNAAEQGLLAMPSVVGQLAQIFIGSLMASHIAKRADAYHARVQSEQQADKVAAHDPGGGTLSGCGPMDSHDIGADTQLECCSADSVACIELSSTQVQFQNDGGLLPSRWGQDGHKRFDTEMI